jgi:GNAT superfamily N-acetyltransferase
MAISEALAIERLGRGDVAAGLALSDAAGWNQTADDWAFFIAAGECHGVRDDAGRLVATAAALPYDARTGWVSMVLVDAAHRHRGIATRLVDACVASLEAQARTPVLDATPAGAAVYARSGFVAGFAFERWERFGAAGERECSNAASGRSDGLVAAGDASAGAGDGAGVGANALGADAAALVSALDRAASGVDRSAFWQAVMARRSTCAWSTPAGDAIAVRRAGRRAAQLGPIVAGRSSDALDLLAAALADLSGAVFVDVPVHCSEIAHELARRGFARQRSFVRMARGDERAAAARPRVFALAGPEFG